MRLRRRVGERQDLRSHWIADDPYALGREPPGACRMADENPIDARCEQAISEARDRIRLMDGGREPEATGGEQCAGGRVPAETDDEPDAIRIEDLARASKSSPDVVKGA